MNQTSTCQMLVYIFINYKYLICHLMFHPVFLAAELT